MALQVEIDFTFTFKKLFCCSYLHNHSNDLKNESMWKYFSLLSVKYSKKGVYFKLQINLETDLT